MSNLCIKKKKVRKSNIIFISFKTYNPANRSTLFRWTLDTLEKSGINVDRYKAAVTRHASTNDAQRRMSDNEVMKFVGWTRYSTTKGA